MSDSHNSRRGTRNGGRRRGREYWSNRPGNRGGAVHTPDAKRRTHRQERRIAARTLEVTQ